MTGHEQKTCLVLSGGGAKGVYHIGAWRALRELGVNVHGFVGASIGAIIAAFLAQGADDVLEEIGRTIAMDSILVLPQTGSILTTVLDKRGIDTSPLRNLLLKELNENLIRASGRDLGVVTVSVSEFQPKELFLNDIEPGLLVDYLMASAAFPGFERTEVAGKHYLDGGLYDNIPYSMARARGYKSIIVIDISGMGRTRKMNIEGCCTTYVRSSIPMGGVLDFDKKFLADFMELGYLDTLKTFGRLAGYQYFIESNNDTLAPELHTRFSEAAIVNWPDYLRHDPQTSLKFLECMASTVDLPRIERYTLGEFYTAIVARQASENAKLATFLQEKQGQKAGLISRIAKAIESRQLDGSPWFYHELIEALLPGTAGDLLQSGLIHLVPELEAGLVGLKG